MMKWRWFFAALAVIAVAACDKQQVRMMGPAAVDERQIVGRFCVFNPTVQTADGKSVSTLLRIDSASGESWLYNSASNRWDRVQDHLGWGGRLNDKTHKFEWGL